MLLYKSTITNPVSFQEEHLQGASRMFYKLPLLICLHTHTKAHICMILKVVLKCSLPMIYELLNFSKLMSNNNNSFLTGLLKVLNKFMRIRV